MECINFIEKSVKILQNRESLKRRYSADIEWLKNRRTAWSANRIRIGVLGVTSCGKSTLINAILGQELLSSAVKPSSSQLVSCTKGKKISADITAIQKFDSAIELIKFQYRRIKPRLSPLGITAMNNCLSDLENKRKKLVYEKKHHAN